MIPGMRAAGIGVLLAAWAASLPAAPPDPHEILRQARLNQLSRQFSLEARLRARSQSVPFRILLDNGEVRFVFRDPPEEILLRIGEDRAELFRVAGGRELPVGAQDADRRVRSSAVSLEDLALKFLYWPLAKYLGDDVLRTRPTHLLELHPRDRNSHYGAARIWVDQSSGALLRIEGFDWEGKLVKRFEVISAQKIEGQWFLKSMRVESFDPATGKVADRAYLEIEPPDG